MISTSSASESAYLDEHRALPTLFGRGLGAQRILRGTGSATRSLIGNPSP